MVKLKPCPFCGRLDQMSIKFEDDKELEPIDVYGLFVKYARKTITTFECECGCTFRTTSPMADIEWNRRANE